MRHSNAARAAGCALIALAAVAARAEENLIADGSFEKSVDRPPAAFQHSKGSAAAGSFELFTEDATWNKCGKLSAGAIHEEKMGGSRGNVYSAGMSAVADVEPDMMYAYSFDLKGNVDCVHVNFTETRKADGREVRSSTRIGTFPVGPEWQRYRGTFRTKADARRLGMGFLIWTQVHAGGKSNFKPGDHVLVDNVSLVKAERLSRRIETLKTTKAKTLVAPIPVETDPACPFLPLELAEAPTQIVFRAAVNEQKPLPIAIGNMTASFMQYRVVLETEPKPVPGRSIVPDDGAFGLEGFPVEKITVREALRFKDSDGETFGVRLDPLATLNEFSVISVPPREAGVVWFDFDTYGVKPGTYRGRFRVIPMTASAKYAVRGGRHVRVRSDEVLLPVAFTVDPIVLPREAVRPAHLCSPTTTEQGYRLEADLGMRIFALGTHSFRTEYIGNANSPFHKTVGDILAWTKRRGVTPLFFVKYDAWGASQALYNPTKDPAKKDAAWETYLHALAKLMGEAGVPFSDYYVLVRDEPKNAELGWVRAAQETLKRLYPKMQTYVSVGFGIDGEVDYIDALGPTTDIWAPVDSAFNNRRTIDRLCDLKATKGAKILHYRCSTSPRDPLGDYFRAHCWRGEYWNTDADMLYHFDIWHPGGDGTWSLKVATTGEFSYRVGGKFCPSVRYMAYREGVTDIKYLEALRQKRGSEPEIRAYLRAATARVFANSSDPAAPARERETIRRKLLEVR